MSNYGQTEVKYSCPESSRFLQLPNFQSLPDHAGVLHFTEDECHEFAGKVCRASCNYPFLFEWHYEILRFVCSELGFSELSQTEHNENGVHRIVQTVTTKGLLKSEDSTTAIWHFSLPNKVLPSAIVSIRDHSIPVDHAFKGEEFFLVRLQDRVFAYDIEKFNIVERVLKNLDYCLHTPRENIGVDPKTATLTIKSTWVWIALSPLRGEAFEEEERVRLSERIAEAQPFFEFKAPIQVNWELLKEPKDDNFQEICRLLLLKEPGIQEVISIGKARAADRGRDFELRQTVKGLTDSTTIKWLVQCKFSSRSISPDTLKGWTDRVREHGYNGFWLMTNNDITPSLFDHFKDVEHNAGIKVKFWQRGDFHTKLNVYAEILTDSHFFEN